MKYKESEEMYLETILLLQQNTEYVIGSDIIAYFSLIVKTEWKYNHLVHHSEIASL